MSSSSISAHRKHYSPLSSVGLKRVVRFRARTSARRLSHECYIQLVRDPAGVHASEPNLINNHLKRDLPAEREYFDEVVSMIMACESFPWS